MPQTNLYQSNFTSGAIDPRVQSRLDITHYANGVEVADNVVVMPYGGLRRRGGLRHLFTVPTAVAGNAMLARFAYNSTDQQYLLLFADSRIYFFRDNALITNINGSGLDYLASPWPIAVARELKWTQSGDTMFVVHEDYQPRTLVRGATDASWTLSALAFTRQPQIDYNDALSPTPTSEVQRITLTSFNTGNTFKLDLENTLTENITYDATNSTAVAARIAEAIGNLYVVRTGEVSCAVVSATVFDVTFSGGSAKNYESMTGFATSGSGTIAVTTTTNGSPRTEDAWSATRGWPRSVTFYESRLVFGGSKSKPQTVFMSKTNGFYDFDLGKGLADDGIQKTLDTDQVNAIVNLIAGRHLQVFTEGAEFFVPDIPITPENSSFRPQTTFGCSTPDPVEVEGSTLFLDRYGRGLQQFLYNDVEAAYSAQSLSRISAHLISAPIDMDIQRSSEQEDTNLVYLVNDDGTCAVLNTLRSEQIAAWTRFTTSGTFLSVAALGEDVYFLVRRTDGTGANAWSVEHLRDDFYLDDAEQYTGAESATWAVGTWLNGLSCGIRGNGAVLVNATPAAGSVTVEEAVTSLELGRTFSVRVKTLPASFNGQAGESQMQRTRIFRILTRVKDTAGLLVNGRAPRERRLDATSTDTAAGTYTGVLENHRLGWGRLQAIEFTQDQPLPLTMLATEYQVEINPG